MWFRKSKWAKGFHLRFAQWCLSVLWDPLAGKSKPPRSLVSGHPWGLHKPRSMFDLMFSRTIRPTAREFRQRPGRIVPVVGPVQRHPDIVATEVELEILTPTVVQGSGPTTPEAASQVYSAETFQRLQEQLYITGCRPDGPVYQIPTDHI